VTVQLPYGSRVDGHAAARFRCQGRLGEVGLTTSYSGIRVEQAGRLRLKSVHGDISVTRSTGHAEVTTTHGSIRIGETDGTAVVKTAHGEVGLDVVTGELRLNSAYGDIDIHRS
jgi:DUF4097 and DUF4098 domain-containing protein YvlB